MKLSKFFILPYCFVYGLQADYLDQFEPESGDGSYKSYSDFFKRKYKSNISVDSEVVWPCEGYVCDWGRFEARRNSLVKGQLLDLNDIFKSSPEQTKGHYFLNIFLHNHNYHRVHMPVKGEIVSIHSIPGDLVFLRPWFYRREDVNYPAYRNERVVFKIKDEAQNFWFLAMVGGFGVGTIEIMPEVQAGSFLSVGTEIAKFNLGSTVCLATPHAIQVDKFLQVVKPGETLIPLKS